MVQPSVILTFIIIDDRTLKHSIRNGPSLVPKLNFRADLKTQCKKRSAIFSSKIYGMDILGENSRHTSVWVSFHLQAYKHAYI